MRFQEVTAADFDDMEKPGTAFQAVSDEVRRLGGGGFMGDRLLDQALRNAGGAADQVAAYNKLVKILNGGECTRSDFCGALEIPYFHEKQRPGILARLKYLITGRA